MSDIDIRIEGRVGRITLNRPDALNAVTYAMVREIDAALKTWAEDDSVAMLLLDAAGEKAFSAGGDIAELYETGMAGDYAYGRRFWADEYRMNARMFEFPKPVASFLQGFTMGGGVGVGCHGSHRIVGDSAQMAMPECGIGLVPDVGGSLILARAPGRLGEYLGVTSMRMDAGNAIYAGFADYYLPESAWPALKAELVASGDWTTIDRAALPAPEASLAADQDEIDRLFGGDTLRDIVNLLRHTESDVSTRALKAMARNAPLSMAAAIHLVRRVRARPDAIRHALGLEYRFTARAMSEGEVLEGIRAAIIDKDRAPKWQPADMDAVPEVKVSQMLMPLGADALSFED